MKRAERAKRADLTIYKIKDDWTDRSFANMDPAQTHVTDSNFKEGKTKTVVKITEQHYPAWKSLVTSITPAADALISSRDSVSCAILFSCKDGSTFVLTFGHGRALLNPEAIERGFGLRCALSIIERDSLVSLDHKRVDITTLFSSLQANRRVQFSNFRMDTDSSMLSAVAGRPQANRDFATKVAGADSLHINPVVNSGKGGASSTFGILGQVEKIYQRKKYQSEYSWVDQMSIVTDKAERARLDSMLDVELKHPGDTIWLGPPERLDYGRIDHFTVVGHRRTQFLGLSITDVVSPDAGEVASSQLLKRRRIHARSAGGETIQSWPVMRWLNWETEDDGSSIILQDGEYYRLDASFEKKIDSAIEQIPSLPDSYIDWGSKSDSDSEEDYNRLLAESLGKPGVFLDTVLFHAAFRGHGSLELCDVLDTRKNDNTKGTFIFVKKYDGGSAPLSHLFTQGQNAIETLLQDEGFRDDIRKKRPALKRVVPKKSARSADYMIAYIILTKEERRRPVTLPFFSKLALYRTYIWASERGIKLSAGTRLFLEKTAKKKTAKKKTAKKK